MSIRRSGLLISCALLALIAGAQTKEPAKKSPARAASPMIVESGSEKWGDIPAGVLVGTPSVAERKDWDYRSWADSSRQAL